jgi:hypothetical protein
MIEMKDNRLVVSFPEVHPRMSCAVTFQRTLRVPDDNQDYPLPAGLGVFPLLPVDDFPVSAQWQRHGGVFLPMYQSEALWLNFSCRSGYPVAVKIAAGKINAVSGQPWNEALQHKPQDYVVLPGQPWLDGYNSGRDVVRQFVAAPLGEGYTAEEQLTGEPTWGGLQLIFYPMKAERIRLLEEERDREQEVAYCRRQSEVATSVACMADDMGLAPGGRIRQEIEKDPYGVDAWDTAVSSRCFVHLMNSTSYAAVTGHAPPTEPITAQQYRDNGVPWFAYYQDGETLEGSQELAGLDGIASAMLKKGKKLKGNEPIQVADWVQLSKKPGLVREGEF